jgi:6-phosphogluconolactonase/glucosamine-6-phosphate isomerase/deaminase
MILTIHADAPTASLSLRASLIQALQEGKPVLWLIPGGSNIPITTAIMSQLPDDLTTNLTVLLTDERYGPVGHADSNAFQLQQAGFNPKKGTFLPVLTGASLEDTIRAYDQAAQEHFAKNALVIGQFGIGADGHIAGILPGSPAATEQHAWATGYRTPSFTRVTLTFPALYRVNVAYTFAYGETKREALKRLETNELPLQVQPAQILKAIPKAYLYTDQ